MSLQDLSSEELDAEMARIQRAMRWELGMRGPNLLGKDQEEVERYYLQICSEWYSRLGVK